MQLTKLRCRIEKKDYFSIKMWFSSFIEKEEEKKYKNDFVIFDFLPCKSLVFCQ